MLLILSPVRKCLCCSSHHTTFGTDWWFRRWSQRQMELEMKLLFLNRGDQQMRDGSVGADCTYMLFVLKWELWAQQYWSPPFSTQEMHAELFARWHFRHVFELLRWKEGPDSAAQHNLTAMVLQPEFSLPGWLDLEYSFMSSNVSVF